MPGSGLFQHIDLTLDFAVFSYVDCDNRAYGNRYLQISAAMSVLAFAAAPLAVLSLVDLVRAQQTEGFDTLVGNKDNGAARPAVATVRATARDIPLSTEMH